MIDAFCDALWLEDGLSANTLAAYRRDLTQLAVWLRQERGLGLLAATHADLLGFLAARYAARTKASSASRLLSTLKRFYRLQRREGVLAIDPTLDIAAPRVTRTLPRSLTEADVEALLAAPDIGQPLGLRDRAMLELLYATGLRVTELVTLRVTQVSADAGVVRVLGKGARERLVPVGEIALDWHARYLRDSRAVLLKGRSSPDLFVTERAGDRKSVV